MERRRWKMERRISLAVVLTMAIQAAAVVIWATQLDARVMAIEERSLDSASAGERFARLEERLDSVKQHVEAVKRQLEFLTEHLINR